MEAIDDLAALRLQLEWGADEALLDTPLDRFAPLPTQAPRPTPAPAPPRPLPAPPAATLAPPAATLADLHAALDALDCPLRRTASHTVRPAGSPEAPLLVLAEAPGPEDDRTGQAFSGPAGQTLDRVMASAGLTRDLAFLAFLVPWRPPGGRPLSPGEVALCLPYAHRMLALMRPRILVLLGGGPLKALTGDSSGIRRARGRWTQLAIPGLPAIPTLPMLPPDQMLATPAAKQATWTDLLALVEALTA